MSKIIFSDLDGTLLNDDKQISTGNREAIRRATRAGHSFVIATGRPFESAKKVSDSLGLNEEGCYIVSYNGAHVYDCYRQEVLLHRTLGRPVVEQLFALADEAGLYIQTYQNGEVLTKADTEELRWYVSHTNLVPMPRADVLDYLTTDPSKMIVISLNEHDRLEQFRVQQEAWSHGRCRMIFSTPKYLEIVPDGVSKQMGIHFLAGKLGVDPADTIAIGDEMNDCEMIEAAGLGVAMSNANPDVKPIADYVTQATNNEDAIAEVIERFVPL